MDECLTSFMFAVLRGSWVKRDKKVSFLFYSNFPKISSWNSPSNKSLWRSLELSCLVASGSQVLYLQKAGRNQDSTGKCAEKPLLEM
ncbi:hypothetical protein CEXT_30761 [Caerostris extrusa]|uniref:Uncharacterized protein n=1 Tax=Caerostris extrusa TaxID=172846 RepID=A0AAV4RT68_CAEEX|nr:hypothetical protein CEXT_30761 [Caerostris extrusa]